MKELKSNPELAGNLLFRMLQIRRFEEKSAEMYTKQHIRGFMHLYIGEEAVAVGIIQALKEQDYVLSTYRDHGHALAKGVSSKAIMAEMFGMMEGCTGGRGGSMHLFDKSKNFVGGNAIVASHLPVAVGLAFGAKRLKNGAIACCFFGEGAAAEGEFHEAMNLAAIWQVPVLFVCENNRYAMGTPLELEHSIENLEIRGSAYGIESEAVDGMNLLAMMEAGNRAVEYIRNTGKPYFLVASTYRFRAHSMFDAELYRSKAEVDLWKMKDPIPEYTRWLLQHHLISDEQIAKMKEKIEEEMEQAVQLASQGRREPVEQLTRFVYTETDN
jgi:pyruvate dehydrogenase E1 component alpha subunit